MVKNTKAKLNWNWNYYFNTGLLMLVDNLNFNKSCIHYFDL